MNTSHSSLILAALPLPAKALLTSILITLTLGMTGAAAQIIIHDIIPTFFSESNNSAHHGGDHHSDNHGTAPLSEKEIDDFFSDMEEPEINARGDLFSDMQIVENVHEKKPFYKTEQFVWTLKWTHIHLFGMNIIFVLLGAVTFFLNMTEKARTLLIVLPFFGIFIDILAMWLKAYASPAFFWLHIPGGGIFSGIFIFVFFRAMREMWFSC